MSHCYFIPEKMKKGGQGYEFIHKSFGEYLTAGGLLSAFLRWADQVADENSDFEVEDQLNRWLSLAGATRLSFEVHAFLKNEVRLRLEQQPFDERLQTVRRHLSVASKLVDKVLSQGFPVTRTTSSFRELEREHLNAEHSLWCTLDALARVAYPKNLLYDKGIYGWKPGPVLVRNLQKSPFALLKLWVRHNDPEGASNILSSYAFRYGLARGLVFRYSNDEPLLSSLVSRLYLKGVFLGGTNLEGWDFEGADLNEADFSASSLVACDFEGANLTKAQFSGAYIESVSFDGATLDHVEFVNCRIGPDVSLRTRSASGTKMPKAGKSRGLLKKMLIR